MILLNDYRAIRLCYATLLTCKWLRITFTLRGHSQNTNLQTRTIDSDKVAICKNQQVFQL